MDDEARVDRMLTGFLRIECGDRLVDHGHRGCASAAGNHSHARGRRKDVNRARLRERSHERANTVFVARLDDHVEGVFALHDGLSLDVDAMVPDVGPVEEHRAHVRVGGRAPLGLVPVTDDEETH